VFFAVGTIGTVPGLRDALLLLADYGLDVDLFVRGDEPFTHPKFGDKRVHVTSDKLGILSRSPTHPRRMRRGNGPYLWVVGHVYHLLWPSLVFLREPRARHRDALYRCIIVLHVADRCHGIPGCLV